MFAVNAVCPGIIRSPLTESYFSDEKFPAELRIFFPPREVGEPEDVASAVRFSQPVTKRGISPVSRSQSTVAGRRRRGSRFGSEDSAYLAECVADWVRGEWASASDGCLAAREDRVSAVMTERGPNAESICAPGPRGYLECPALVV